MNRKIVLVTFECNYHIENVISEFYNTSVWQENIPKENEVWSRTQEREAKICAQKFK